MGSAAAVAAPMAQNVSCVRIHQDSEAGAQAIGFGIDQCGALRSDASAQHASQAEQGSAAANLTGLAAAVADDFTIRAQNSFQERNGAENWLPSFTVGHKTLFVQG